ncbi:MAG: NAD(P)-dependent oxidoreductase [Anaerolineales bacterium]|nr:NAD(P)-dependent oxidoreductase [Anaerolineales bacterium]
MAKETIGFIGLGRMGSRMAVNVAKAGYPLTVFNRDPEKTRPLLEIGASAAASPAEAARVSQVVITMVSDSDALYQVALGSEGVLEGLQPDAVFIDMSTVDPVITRNLAEETRARGGHMLDAPVSGSTALAEAGTLSIMVGGSEQIMARVNDILLSMGSRTTYVGPNGAAASMKLAVNIVIGVTMQVVAESVVLAERAGIPPEVAVDVLANSAIGSPFVKYKAPQLLEPAGPAAFTAELMQKDLSLAIEMARRLNVPLPTTAAANEMLTVARGMGLGERDFAAVVDIMRELSRGN